MDLASADASTQGPGLAARAPAIFVGRSAELERFAAATRHVRLGVIYGVGGVGKTAFLLRAAEELARVAGARLAYHPCRRGESIATVAELVSRQLGAPAPSPALPAVGALLRVGADAPLVLCLDDLHRAGPEAGLLEAILHLARQRAPLWVCVASREDLGIDPASIDHLVIRLRGLSAEEARRLWHELEQLYGPARCELDEGRAGSPLLLKQAFAGPASHAGADPLALATLPPAAAELLSLACAMRGPVPAGVLTGARAPGEVTDALAVLERRFLLERTLAGAWLVHDVVREEVLRSPLAPGAPEHRRCLAFLTAGSGDRDAAADLAREILFHAVACGDDGRAEAILARHASPAARALPPGTVMERSLADALDRLSERRTLPIPFALLRERIRCRQGGARDAHDAVGALAATGDPLALLDHAEIALTIGRTEEALASLSRASDHPGLDPLGRMWIAVLRALAHNGKGDVAQARGALDAASAAFRAAGPLGEAVRRACDGIIEADREDYDAARRAFDDVRRLSGATAPLGFRLMASVDRLASAALGRSIAGAAGEDDLFDETLLFRVAARLLHVQELLIRGRARPAAELAEATLAAAIDAGHGALTWWGAWLCGEAASIVGSPTPVPQRLREHLEAARAAGWTRATARLEAIAARAHLDAGELDDARRVALAALPDAADLPWTRARLRAVVLLADAAAGIPPRAGARTRRADELSGCAREEWRLAHVEADLWAGRLAAARREAEQAEAIARRAGWQLLACRAGRLGAEASYRLGDVGAAALALASTRRDAACAGQVAETIRARLLAAALLRTRGDAAGMRGELEACAADAWRLGLAIEGGAADVALGYFDGKQIPRGTPPARLAARYGLCEPIVARVRGPGESHGLTAAQRAALDDRRYDLFVDLVARRVRTGRRTVDLSRSPALAVFLGVLAREPGRVVSSDAIVEALWSVEYHPVRHHSRLTVQATRLRKVVGAGAIVGEQSGYRLAPPASWAVLEAAPAGAYPDRPE